MYCITDVFIPLHYRVNILTDRIPQTGKTRFKCIIDWQQLINIPIIAKGLPNKYSFFLVLQKINNEINSQ